MIPIPGLSVIRIFWILLINIFILLSCQPSARFRSPSGSAEPLRKANIGLLQREALRWIHTPYRLGGTDSTGIDCSGLVQRIYATVYNLHMPREAAQQRALGSSVDKRYLRPGDLLFFRFRGPGGINHVGIYLGEKRFLHASSSRGVVISSLDDSYYRRHLIVARRYAH